MHYGTSQLRSAIRYHATPDFKDYDLGFRLIRIVKETPGEWTDPVTGMVFVKISGGTFQMGSDQGMDDEKPIHTVTVDEFWMGKYEVTQAQWEKLTGSNPSYYIGTQNPVGAVSWDDIQGYIGQLNSQGSETFRLPTEAEWEYACRAGTTTEYYWGDSLDDADEYAWYGTPGAGSHPVGQKKPNQFGLYDMSGNAIEWCQDWYGYSYYAESPQSNPTGPSTGGGKVLRGGSEGLHSSYMRSATRGSLGQGSKNSLHGFRLVRPVN